MKAIISGHYFAIAPFPLYIVFMKTPHMACFLLALLLTIVMVSCSRSGSGEIPIGEQELPDMVMKDAVYTLSQTDESPMVMQASLISIYGTGRDTELEKSASEGAIPLKEGAPRRQWRPTTNMPR